MNTPVNLYAKYPNLFKLSSEHTDIMDMINNINSLIIKKTLLLRENKGSDTSEIDEQVTVEIENLEVVLVLHGA